MRASSWRWVVLGLVVFTGGYMVVDGLRALLVGDYFTPQTGEYAGRLGPWADLVGALGIGPRSPFMKTLFVVWGSIWIGLASWHVKSPEKAWTPLFVMTLASLWYLVIGTLFAAVAALVLWVGKPDRRDA